MRGVFSKLRPSRATVSPDAPPDGSPVGPADGPAHTPLARLREQALPPQPFAPGDITPGFFVHHDPAMQVTGTLSSPRGRLLELATTVTTPGAWCALHLALGPLDLQHTAHLVATLRTTASPAVPVQLALRSGTDAGFHDQFFARDVLCQPSQTDHLDMLTPAHCTDLPPQAPWRELIIFLPPGRSITWSLHDLRWTAL